MFCSRLKELRKRRGYTLEKLANKYNEQFGGKLTKGALSRYENGKHEPMVSVIVNLAKLLGVSSEYLIGRTESESQEPPATESQLKFALFNGTDGVTDEMLDEVKEFAAFVMEKNKKK